MVSAIATILIASSFGRPAKACIVLQVVDWVLQKEQLGASRPAMPQGGGEQARDRRVVALARPGDGAGMSRQAGDLVARVQGHCAQRAFDRTVVLAAEDLEGAIGVPVAVGALPANLGVAAETVAVTGGRCIRGQVEAVERPPDPFHVALPVLLLSAGVCDRAYAAVGPPATGRGAVLHASAAAVRASGAATASA